MNDKSMRDGCARVRERLERYLDGALPPLEAARDGGHLEACGECARELGRCVELLATIRAASGADAEELRFARLGLAARLEAATPARPQLRLLHSRVVRAAATAAAAIAALFALQLLGSDLGQLGTLPKWTDDLLARTHLEVPVWSDVLGDLWSGRDT